jgi:hypothetical protein
MNERFKELADQARKYARDYVADCKHYGHYMEHNELDVRFEEKFAELIVRKCVDIIQRESEKAIRNNTYMGDDVPASVTQWAIKKHFGVEE